MCEEGANSVTHTQPKKNHETWVGHLKPGTASGYVGVQRVKSKKRPWQAMISSRQETTMCGVLQGTRACCSGQGKGLRRPSAPESAKAGFTKLRFGDMPARRDPLPFLINSILMLSCSTHACACQSSNRRPSHRARSLLPTETTHCGLCPRVRH